MENKDGQLTSGSNLSHWTDSVEQPKHLSELRCDLETDVVIIGGGLAGVSVAYCLTRSGKKVVLVEDGFIGSGESGRTTAHLVTALDDRYYYLQRYFGEEKTRLIAQSHAAAIDFVERTVKAENIDCDFERLDGFLFRHPTDKEDSLKKEFDAARKAGLHVDEWEEVIPGTGKSIRFPNQAQFHPLRYMLGLCGAIMNKGGQIYINTHASEISASGIKTSSGYTVKASHVVVATNSPVSNKFAIHLKQYPYRTYVIGAKIKKDSLFKGLWWDTGDFEMNPDIPPYHFVRLAKYNDEYDLLISGGEDHPNADTSNNKVPEEERYEALEEWTRRHFKIEDVVYRWSGQVMEPMDGIAYIGKNPFDKDNVYIVTGDSGNGMTHCTIAGVLITDLINGKENPWEDVYKPSRFTFKASKPFFKELIGTLVSAIKKDKSHAEHVTLATLPNGEARHMELHGEKCGVYRDDHGHLHVVSTTCTHVGCTVKWNNDEKSWDCPCHGSRFTYKGTVMNGPANKDLHAYSEEPAPDKKLKSFRKGMKGARDKSSLDE